MAAGRIDVDDMLAEMSSRQLSEWMAFSQLEPFGFKANLFGHAVTTSTNINMNLKKGKTPLTPNDVIDMVFGKETTEVRDGHSFFHKLKQYLAAKNKDK